MGPSFQKWGSQAFERAGSGLAWAEPEMWVGLEIDLGKAKARVTRRSQFYKEP